MVIPNEERDLFQTAPLPTVSLFSTDGRYRLAGDLHVFVPRRYPADITPETASAFLPGRFLIESKLHLRSKVLDSLFGVELGNLCHRLFYHFLGQGHGHFDLFQTFRVGSPTPFIGQISVYLYRRLFPVCQSIHDPRRAGHGIPARKDSGEIGKQVMTVYGDGAPFRCLDRSGKFKIGGLN